MIDSTAKGSQQSNGREEKWERLEGGRKAESKQRREARFAHVGACMGIHQFTYQ